MSFTIELSSEQKKDLIAYCNLNNLEPEQTIKKCFLEGYRIEKYGLLNSKDRIIEKEVIVEVPKIEYVEVEKIVEVVKEIIIEKPVDKIVEIIKEVPTIEYVEVIKEIESQPVEVVKYIDREVIKEVFIEKDVTNFDNFCDKKYVDELKQKIFELENKPPLIKEVLVEVIKETVVEKEVPVEIIKEVVIEKDNKELREKFDLLQQTLLKLRQESLDKDKQLKEYENLIQEIEKAKDKQAAFMRGSNLGNKLY